MNLWKKVIEANDVRKEKRKVPLEEVNPDKYQVDVDVGSRYGQVSIAWKETKASDMKVLPSFLGSYDGDEDIQKSCSLYHPNPNILDASNKQK